MIVISPGVGVVLRSAIEALRSLPTGSSRARRGVDCKDSTLRCLPVAAEPLRYLAAMGRIGVLASGSGTILAALAAEQLRIVVVVVDRPCGAVGVAGTAGIPVEIVGRASFGADFDRVAYTHEVVDALRRHGVDLVAMAGFGTI